MSFFLVKGSHSIKRIEEFGMKAYAVTDTETYKIRENLHSDTFILKNGDEFHQIHKIYEFSPVDFKDVYDFLPCSSLLSSVCSLETVSLGQIFTMKQLMELSEKFFVFFDGDSSVCKFTNRDMAHMLKYRQSWDLSPGSAFKLFDSVEWNTGLKIRLEKWIKSFSSEMISILLGFFILLDCLERDRLDSFISEWRKADLNEIDLRSQIRFVCDSFLEKAVKTRVKQYLSKLV